MHLKRLKLTGFRNYLSAETELSAGTTIILGTNGAGKTSLLEAAQYVICGQSFRTSRDAEMVTRSGGFFRLEAEVSKDGLLAQRAVGYEPGAGARVNTGGGPEWFPSGSVLCFSPDELRLVKGPPAVRRRFLDEATARRTAAGRRLVLDYSKVLSQRNSFMQRARAGLVDLSGVSPWDRQLAQLAIRIYALRRDHIAELSPHFREAYREISGNESAAGATYCSQLDAFTQDGDPEAAMMRALSQAWQKDMERLSTSVGTHLDEVEFTLEEKSLRLYGSQGEQRTAVLALLIASSRMALESGAPAPLLLLDDVMSELDPGRRRRLMKTIGAPAFGDGAKTGQVVITAADESLFTGEELDSAAVLWVREGTIMEGVKPVA